MHKDYENMASITATQVAQKLDISRSYLYYLKESNVFQTEIDSNGRTKWNLEILEHIKKYLANKKNKIYTKVSLPYKIITINNRRYLGNKYKLLPIIRKIVDEECIHIKTVADIFAGTGAVAYAFADKKIITNDILYSNYICHFAFFDSQEYSEEKIINYILYYNGLDINEENYMTKKFSNTFFSKKDCAKIGFIREDIEKIYSSGKVNKRERALLITSLLYAMDKIANTCGHYDAYRKRAIFDKSLELAVPLPIKNPNPNNQCFNRDATELVQHIETDLLYIDPPYNSRQYCDSYHLLENVAKWEKPKVEGISRKMDRKLLKSDYCTINATNVFENLISNTKAKYILLSYNNMAEKGNSRSNAKIKDIDILRILNKKGKVKVFSKNYKAFTTGKSNIKENEERLFLCKCYDFKKEIIQSPLNYIGGKFKLLPQILPLFPKNIDLFVDLFCGGCNVGINVDCRKVIFNDNNVYLQNLSNFFKKLDKNIIFDTIYKIINKYKLSQSSIYGYNYFNCNSQKGLTNYNREGFIKLREDFNKRMIKDYYYYLMLYVLIVYSFNNQIRFNNAGMFNLPVGKRDFNSRMKLKLSNFIDRIQCNDYEFTNQDFVNFDINKLNEESFVYIDPPYLITHATYNEQGKWTESNEKKLLDFLDKLNSKNIRFALSNVIEHKGEKNNILIKWLNNNKDKYTKIDLSYNYSNANYQIKDRNIKTKEVLIINYKNRL